MIDRVDRDVQRLLHMLEGIKRLKQMLDGLSREDFLDDYSKQDAASFVISTVGEAASHISEGLQAKYPDIPWRQLRGIRNRLVHIFDYDEIDYDIVWNVATLELPAIEPRVREALASIPLPDDFTLPEV